MSARLVATVHGDVQGVGFRSWVRSRARRLGLVGTAANCADGTVEVVAEGPEQACHDLLAALRSGSTPGRVHDVAERFDAPRGDRTDFVEL